MKSYFELHKVMAYVSSAEKFVAYNVFISYLIYDCNLKLV